MGSLPLPRERHRRRAIGPVAGRRKRAETAFCEVLHYDSHGKIISGELFYDNLSMLVQPGHMKPMDQG